MGARSHGREAALQMLYALDIVHRDGGDVDVERLVSDYWAEVPGDVQGRDFADQLVCAVANELSAIDELIRAASKHWRLERMARVDRNVLRLGTYELKASADVPRAVVIDQAVELAKRFGAEGSTVFVNGVLDRIADDLGR